MAAFSLCLHVDLPLHRRVSKFPFLRILAVVLGLGSMLLQYQHLLTNYTCRDPIPALKCRS